MSRADVVHAAFDVPLDPRRRDGSRLRGAFTSAPVAVLSTTRLAGVPDVVAAAEAAARAGHWVVGGLSYEAGGAWDAAQATHPGPGELARFEVFAGEPVAWPDAAPPADADWFPSGRFRVDSPAAALAAVQGHIGAGDCYQVNLTTRVATVPRLAGGPEPDLYPRFRSLAAAQPGGYAVYSRGAGVASVSPELFVHVHPDGRLVTQPMKGTAPAASSPRLLQEHPKERAENLMIVDLLRNDLGRVCRPGTVRVDALFELLELPTVWQLVSTVSGRARPGTSLTDVFAALFPCGSVTGAPKIRAMQVIAGLEGQPRGWYCGTLGVIRPGGEAVFNVAIRTVERVRDRLECGVGSGIVADSDPVAELAEWRAKSRFLGGATTAALETLLLADGRYPRLTAHLDRLRATERDLGLGVDPGRVEQVLRQAAAERPEGRWRVRLTAHDLAAEVTVLPLAGDGFPSPVPLVLADEPLDTTALRPVVAHKTTWRAHYDRLRSRRPGHAFDVICHTPDGLVTEATLGNLGFLLDGRWVTPPVSSGLLAGVERQAQLAAGRLVEAEIRLADLARVEQVAFLNAVRGWLPAVLV